MESTTYDVAWCADAPGTEIQKTTVKIIDGYSTVADIPKIIAVTRTGDASLASLVRVLWTVAHAVPGTECEWVNGYGQGCRSRRDRKGDAVHVLTQTLPVAPVGTPLCAFHSPYDYVTKTSQTAV